MAERRMFAKSIINSARFLRMPQSSRLLYYDLGMAADDDGVVEAFTVLRTTGAAEDDLRVLATKGFISVLNEDLVSYIADWGVNNQIRKDRYRPSVYSDLLVRLEDGNQTATTWQPDDNQMESQYRIGKERTEEVSREEDNAGKPPTRSRFVPPSIEEVRAYCLERGNKVDPQRFVDFYQANGWMRGKNRIKDWKAAVRTWESNDRANKSGTKTVNIPGVMEV